MSDTIPGSLREIEDRMRNLADNHGPSGESHMEADDLLCEALRLTCGEDEAGFRERIDRIIGHFQRLEKWWS